MPHKAASLFADRYIAARQPLQERELVAIGLAKIDEPKRRITFEIDRVGRPLEKFTTDGRERGISAESR